MRCERLTLLLLPGRDGSQEVVLKARLRKGWQYVRASKLGQALDRKGTTAAAEATPMPSSA